MPINNHAVLLKGVNDSLATMRDLCRALLRIKVRPYYLFHCDPVTGAGHFRTSVWKGMEIMEGLRGHMSGLGIPTYVVDSPHGGGKIPLMPNYLVSASDDAVVLRNYEGMLVRYHPTGEPSEVADPVATQGVSGLLSGQADVLVPEGNPRLGRREDRATLRPQRQRHGNGNGTERQWQRPRPRSAWRTCALRIGIAFDLIPVERGRRRPRRPVRGVRQARDRRGHRRGPPRRGARRDPPRRRPRAPAAGARRPARLRLEHRRRPGRRAFARGTRAGGPEMLGIPYSGSDPLTLAAALDKDVSRRLVRSRGVRIPEGMLVTPGADPGADGAGAGRWSSPSRAITP